MVEAFKVVRRINSSLKSAFYFNYYQVGIPTVPQEGSGPLTCFKSLESAIRFIDGGWKDTSFVLEVWRANAEVVEGDKVWYLNETHCEDVKKMEKRNHITNGECLLCSSITLIERVNENDYE